MPTCFVTLSESVAELSPEDAVAIRAIVAKALDSGARRLDQNHVVLRVLRSTRADMLGEVEMEVFAQFFLRRFFSRDKRANLIASHSTALLKRDCACWINMAVVGYSRVTTEGKNYFSN